VMTTEYDCPICIELATPIKGSMSIGKIHYMDSRYVMTCDECKLVISTNKWRELTSAALYKTKQEEE
jgi:hypothetical protein